MRQSKNLFEQHDASVRRAQLSDADAIIHALARDATSGFYGRVPGNLSSEAGTLTYASALSDSRFTPTIEPTPATAGTPTNLAELGISVEKFAEVCKRTPEEDKPAAQLAKLALRFAINTNSSPTDFFDVSDPLHSQALGFLLNFSVRSNQ